MPTEILRPNGAGSQFDSFDGDYTDINDDSDSTFVVVQDDRGNITGTIHVTFPTPTGDPDGTQTFYTRGAIGSGTGFDGDVELWENGSFDSALGALVLTGSTTNHTHTWDASALGTADGSLVEYLYQHVSGGFGELYDVWWDCNYTAGGGTDALTADDVGSTSGVTSPSVGQEHALSADNVGSTSGVSTPSLSEVVALTANDVGSASGVTEPSLGQVHALAASDVGSTSGVTAPSIGQTHTLAASDVGSSSGVTTPDVGQVHGLAAADVGSTSGVTEPTLAEATDALTAEDVGSTSGVSEPSLGQVHALAAADVGSQSGVSEPALASAGEQPQPTPKGPGPGGGFLPDTMRAIERGIRKTGKRRKKDRDELRRLLREAIEGAEAEGVDLAPVVDIAREVEPVKRALPNLAITLDFSRVERALEAVSAAIRADLEAQEAQRAVMAAQDEEDALVALLMTM